MADIIYFVIPCYNEEKVLPITATALAAKVRELLNGGLIAAASRVLFVDDGSKDNTWNLIESLAASNPLFTGVKLSRNEGQQSALFAGLMAARDHADAVISLDADLQDDISVVKDFLKAYADGCDIVYGVRNSRKKDGFWKRLTAEKFYGVMRLLDQNTVFNHADYRLMSKRALDCLAQFSEVNLFLRGTVPLIGFKSTTVPYERQQRAAGTSKYTPAKMFNLALDGLTAASTKPLRCFTAMGCGAMALSFLFFVLFVISKISGFALFGISGLFCSLWLLGGLELCLGGLLGEYLGKVLSEVKARPRYFIEKNLADKAVKEKLPPNMVWEQPNVSPYGARTKVSGR